MTVNWQMVDAIYQVVVTVAGIFLLGVWAGIHIERRRKGRTE